MTDARRNWAGNHAYAAARQHRPETVEHLQELVRRSGKLKALGTRHSFNGIADTPEDLVSLERLNRIVALDRERRTVTLEAGVRYGELCRYLHGEGFALHNLASLPHISVAGACATATHGSGEDHGNLATAVSALELVAASGDELVLSRDRDPDEFRGAVVGLGGLGIVTRLTLDLVPAYEVRQDVYENLPMPLLAENLDEILASAYSVSLFTGWQRGVIDQVWLKRVVKDGATFEPEPEWFGATLAPADRHPIARLSAVNCTKQMGVPGPWHERMPHFRLEFTPSAGEELQSEYLVPREHALEAFRAIERLRERIAPVLQISEVRTVAADDLWMSPFYRRACVGIHFTWTRDWAAVSEILPLIEHQLAPFDARPHWGKLFTMPPARLRSLYERLPDFQRLLRTWDPEAKFRNAFLDGYVFGEA